MLKSLRMVEKFEGSAQEKSIEIDAKSASSNDFQIEADVDKEETEPSPVIKSEAPKEQLQTAPKPDDDKVLLQQKCQALIKALNEDCDKKPSEGKKEDKDKSEVKLSEIDLVAKHKILYLTDMENAKFNPQYRENLINMMNMGFFDFKKNLQLLQKHFNNLELVCAKILE